LKGGESVDELKEIWDAIKEVTFFVAALITIANGIKALRK